MNGLMMAMRAERMSISQSMAQESSRGISASVSLSPTSRPGTFLDYHSEIEGKWNGDYMPISHISNEMHRVPVCIR